MPGNMKYTPFFLSLSLSPKNQRYGTSVKLKDSRLILKVNINFIVKLRKGFST